MASAPTTTTTATTATMTTPGPTMMKSTDREELRALPGNDMCIDCPRRNPEWASVSLGIFLCLECSGLHRGLGTHISFVRSVRMDSWSDAQLASMRASGGNDAARAFLSDKGGIDMHPASGTSVRDKYDSPAGELWRRVLKARASGEEEPTELPVVVVSDDDDSESGSDDGSDDGSESGSDDDDDDDDAEKESRGGNVGGAVKIMEGFGSSPHPSTLKPEKKRRVRRIVGAAAAGIGAVAGFALNRRRKQKEAANSSNSNNMVSASLSMRV